MTQLAPHIILRTDSTSSQAAAMLRDGGYLVTKMRHDTDTVKLANMDQADAVVLDLPLHGAIAFVKGIGRTLTSPLLVLTHTPAVVRRSLPGVNVFDLHDSAIDLITTTDLLLARSEGRRMPLARAM